MSFCWLVGWLVSCLVKKTTNFLFFLPFDPKASKTWKNSQKTFLFCVFYPYLGVVKDRLSNWLAVQTLNDFWRDNWKILNFRTDSLFFPYQGILIKQKFSPKNVVWPQLPTTIFTSPLILIQLSMGQLTFLTNFGSVCCGLAVPHSLGPLLALLCKNKNNVDNNN